MGQATWLTIENQTAQRVFVQVADDAEGDYLIGLEAGDRELVAHEKCDAAELVATAGSTNGPVAATRPEADGRGCLSVWIISAEQ